MSERRWDRVAIAAIAAGAIIRAVWILVAHPPLDYVYSDMEGYVDRARELADGVPLERYDAFYPPGTHLLLSVPLELAGTGRAGLWADAVLWLALSAATPFFMWRLARLLLSPAAAALTAVLCALWPLHVSYAGYFLSETPSLAFLAGSLWLGYRAVQAGGGAPLALGAAAGLLGGAAVASRPQLLLNVAILIVPLVLRRRLREAAAIGIGVAVVLTGVVAHNSEAAGKLTGLSENGGLTFFLGHCDVRELRVVEPGGRTIGFGPPPALQRPGGETHATEGIYAGDQGFFYGEAFECIRDDGLGHLRIAGRSLADMTATSVPWPQVTEKRHGQVTEIVNALYSATLPLVVVGAVLLIGRRRRAGQPSGELVLLAHLAALLPVAILVFGDPRFRTPYDVFGLALLAAIAADRFVERGAERDSSS